MLQVTRTVERSSPSYFITARTVLAICNFSNGKGGVHTKYYSLKAEDLTKLYHIPHGLDNIVAVFKIRKITLNFDTNGTLTLGK